VKKQNKYHLDIKIDKLTNSILNTISGDSFPTDVHPVTKSDLKTVTRKNGWLFTWTTEIKYSYIKIKDSNTSGPAIIGWVDSRAVNII
jgi:hypothetical protein